MPTIKTLKDRGTTTVEVVAKLLANPNQIYNVDKNNLPNKN
ncbi:hypothetical protein LCGC14_1524890 [marine sediment metagenome]|uniref:Uncharacterized protein n=1 Tax=marine sediment metagenome TaxID=412755 RepID=A0A0F9LYJ5_9ZZZZ